MGKIHKSFWILVLLCSFVYSGEFENVLQDVELHIESTYKTELARESAIKKLKDIINDKTLSEKDKIARMREDFLKNNSEGINENNAYKLLYIRPLTWTVHSIAIAYDIENTQQVLLSGKVLDTQDASASKRNSGTSTISSFIGASSKLSMNADARLNFTFNPLKLLSSKGSFSAEADACVKGDVSKQEQEIWSKERQVALSEKLDTMFQVLSDTKITGCHLTFAVTFKNNLNKDLYFDSESTIPVFANGELVLNAMPENINGSKEQILPSKSTVTVKFRGGITNTKAQTLLRFMTSNSPSILPEQGQLFIFSRDQLERNVAQKSMAIPTIGIHCDNLEWRIRKTWNYKNVTLKEALMAVNSIYNNPVPFEMNDKECVTIFKMPFADTIKSFEKYSPFILIEMDKHIYSSITEKMLNSTINGDIRIHVVDNINDIFLNPTSNDNVKYWLFSFIKDLSKKDIYSKYLLAMLLTDSYPLLPTDFSKSYALFTEILNNNDNKEYKDYKEQAELMIAILELAGVGTKKNILHAKTLLDKLAETAKDPELKVMVQLISAMVQIDKSINPNNTEEEQKKGFEKLMNLDSSKLDESLLGYYSLLVAMYHLHYYDGGEANYLKAIPFLIKASENGVPNATFMLACCYYEGTGIEKDYKKAFSLLEECSAKFDELRMRQVYNANDGMLTCYLLSLVLLGDCYELGHGTKKDINKANDYYKKAADFGDAEGQWRYAKALMKMIPNNLTDKDMLRAQFDDYLTKAVKQNHPSAQATASELILSDPSSDENDKKFALTLLESALEQNDLEALVVQADCLLNGWGMTKNEKQAFECYKVAADNGHIGAIRMVGLFYLEGQGGVNKNEELGIKYIIKASNNNDPLAQFIYGSALLEGYEPLGIAKDLSRGNALINSAAEQGCEKAIEYKRRHK